MGSNPTEGALQFFSLILFFLISIKRLVHLFFRTNQKMFLVNVEQNYIPHICANSPSDLKKMVHPNAHHHVYPSALLSSIFPALHVMSCQLKKKSILIPDDHDGMRKAYLYHKMSCSPVWARFSSRKQVRVGWGYTTWGKTQLFIQKFLRNWCLKNVNFVKNEILKMWILWKMRLWNCDFVSNAIFKMWIFG